MQITYLNGVVMPDEDTSGSSDDDEKDDAQSDNDGAAAEDNKAWLKAISATHVRGMVHPAEVIFGARLVESGGSGYSWWATGAKSANERFSKNRGSCGSGTDWTAQAKTCDW
jgi:hypothetical protein